MSKKYTATFIGGPFDLTRRIVAKPDPEMYFYEPLHPEMIAINKMAAQTITCRRVVYSLVKITNQNNLIYEYMFTDGWSD